MADAVSLEQVLHNLVRNAAEALAARTGAGRPAPLAPGSAPGLSGDPVHWIRLVAIHNDAIVTIVVEDNGPGMAPNELEQIFTPFYTTKEGGMGLGLPLCERLMEAMGGRIQAESGIGKGTRFTLTLKAAA
ncbi:ATP-binding protein [Pigmentiphaga litoralis]|uniref:ATP-binding protein n=1 Tax=Pigmentiphaga litoralis TaxID=516702 RepID=UPI003B42D84A